MAVSFQGRARLRGEVIAGGAAIALKNLVNFTTNLLTNFTTNFTRRVARAVFRALLTRAVRGRTRAVLRVGESDSEGGHWPMNVGSVGTTGGDAAARSEDLINLCSSVFICGCLLVRARYGSVSGPAIGG